MTEPADTSDFERDFAQFLAGQGQVAEGLGACRPRLAEKSEALLWQALARTAARQEQAQAPRRQALAQRLQEGRPPKLPVSPGALAWLKENWLPQQGQAKPARKKPVFAFSRLAFLARPRGFLPGLAVACLLAVGIFQWRVFFPGQAVRQAPSTHLALLQKESLPEASSASPALPAAAAKPQRLAPAREQALAPSAAQGAMARSAPASAQAKPLLNRYAAAAQPENGRGSGTALAETGTATATATAIAKAAPAVQAPVLAAPAEAAPVLAAPAQAAPVEAAPVPLLAAPSARAQPASMAHEAPFGDPGWQSAKLGLPGVWRLQVRNPSSPEAQALAALLRRRLSEGASLRIEAAPGLAQGRARLVAP